MPSELDPGTDISAIIWKCFQSTNIQIQLDSSHNLYNKNNKTEICSSSTCSVSSSRSSSLKVSSNLTLDEILKSKKKK